jgi:hypothetical protein
LPGHIEAESYMRYYDTSGGNSGTPSCSSTDVDAQTTSDVGGGCNVGWTAPGEWLEYDVSVARAGNYDITARLAASDGGRRVHLELDGATVGSALTAPSLGWQAFSSISARSVPLPAGDHTLRLVFENGLTNVNWLEIQEPTAPPPPQEPPSSGLDGCKRGLAYGQHSVADLNTLSQGISWWYNWDQRPDSAVRNSYTSTGVEFVPMIWGSAHIGRADADVPNSGMNTLLGFNEPNFFAQANLSPEEAARLWPELERVARNKGIDRIASPAVNYCGGGCWDTDPVSYLDRFFAECNRLHQNGCQVDIIAYHAYVCRLEWLTPKIDALHKYNLPIWLTEFACGDSSGINEDMQVSYMQAAVPWLESNSRVERYAWFSGRTNIVPYASLLGQDGQLTRLGRTYVELPHNSNCPL